MGGVRLCLAASPQVLILSLFLWHCRCGGHPLEDNTAHSHPGRPARLHSWSYSAPHPGAGGRRGQRRHWGSLGGLPRPASFLLIRPGLAGGRLPLPRHGEGAHWGPGT